MMRPMRVLFLLPGLHRLNRGAEVAFISVASELAKTGDEVTLIGSGRERDGTPYRFLHAGSLRRENFEHLPSMPFLRDECAYEELSFVPDALRRYHPADYDVVVGCSYPYANWLLRRPVLRGARPPHVFVTQNSDWPAYARNSEYRFFSCEGLVCTNPTYYQRNKERWRSVLIPNGVNCDLFTPGVAQRQKFGLPLDRSIVLMVSALIPSKRVAVGVEAVSQIPDLHLVVAGDGPLRHEIEADANRFLPGRFSRLSVTPDDMPLLYRSADIFLHLSKDEPSSLAFLEAMACGLPVVAHDAPQLRWIAGDDEFLLDTENPKHVAEQIERARKTGSDNLQKRLNKVQNFSWKKLAARYRDFFEVVVGS